MSMDQFNKWLVQNGAEKTDTGFRFGFVIEKRERGNADRQMWATISTGKLDRQGDILSQQGMDSKAYMKNPVVLWAHMYQLPPVAKALKLEKEKNKTRALFEFADTPMANEIFYLYDQGFLHAFSVGALPKKWDVINDAEGRFQGYRIDEWELLEFSCVPVPANPQALREEMDAGRVKDAVLRKAFGLDAPVDAPAPENMPSMGSSFHDSTHYTQVAPEIRTEQPPVEEARQDVSDAPVTVLSLKVFTEMMDALKKSITALEKKIPAEAAPVAPSQPVVAVPQPKTILLPDAEKVAEAVLKRLGASVSQEADKAIRRMRGQLD